MNTPTFPVPMSHTIKMQRAQHAIDEAAMEIRITSFEKDAVAFERRLGEQTVWKGEYQRLEKQAVPSLSTPPGTPARFFELQGVLDAMNEAQRQFNIAFDQQNKALFVRWLKDWRSRRSEWEELANKWLQDYPDAAIENEC
jgi:hypothetical protein